MVILNYSITVNVLAILEDKSDFLAYIPIEIVFGQVDNSVPTYLYIIICIVVFSFIILCIIAYVLYKKFIGVKLRLDYEVNDIRNMGNLPKSDAELSEIKMKTGELKYSNLNEEKSSI